MSNLVLCYNFLTSKPHKGENMKLIDKYLASGESTWCDIADRVSGVMSHTVAREEAMNTIGQKLFIPNSPALVWANREGGRSVMACNVLHISNSIEEIMQAAKDAATVFKAGGGIGLEFSALSPAGTPLKYSRGGTASGPVSFMQIFDAVAQAIKEGGLRRAAMMATLNTDHPDIMEFIKCKTVDGELSNFNVSVTVGGGPRSVKRSVWEAICKNAYNNGEPGMIFLDHVNANNPLRDELGDIIAVNACAEVPMYHGGSCCLGHIVLPNVIRKLGDWTELKRIARFGVRFLNRMIDVNHYPLPIFAQLARDIRNIGVGVMGWSDLLKANSIPFVSSEALALTEEIGRVIAIETEKESAVLAEISGGYRPGRRRNAFLRCIAPTGHTSRLAGVENSIYPDYATGMQMSVTEHLDHVAAWQKWIDNAISYTISFPNDSPPEITDRIFRGAHARGIKVMSVYRDGSREGQPCTIDGECGIPSNVIGELYRV